MEDRRSPRARHRKDEERRGRLHEGAAGERAPGRGGGRRRRGAPPRASAPLKDGAMSALGVRAAPRPEGPRQASFYELVERLLSDAFTLFDHKLALATLEMKQHAESAARGLAVVAAGALAAAIGLSLLAVAAAVAIGRVLDSPAGGYLIVGAVIAVAGAIAIGV